MITPEQNNATVLRLTRDWNLGPTRTSIDKYANTAFWTKIAKAWGVSEDIARRQLCANCEYYDNTPEMQAEMEIIPINALDRDGGGRGFCHKFDFICHNLRTCQAWERKDFILPDSETDESDQQGD